METNSLCSLIKLQACSKTCKTRGCLELPSQSFTSAVKEITLSACISNHASLAYYLDEREQYSARRSEKLNGKRKRRGLMQMNEWSNFRHNSLLNVELLHAQYVNHAYPRHSHDYYVISLIEKGNQSFTHKGTKYTTSPGGVILINPGDVHTGEAADKQGFELRSLYPTISHMETAIYELTGHHYGLPFFTDVQVHSSWLSRNFLSMHRMLFHNADSLESESRFISLLTHLVKLYIDSPLKEQRLGSEKKAIVKARQYIDENFARGVCLQALSQYVSLSPFYLLRAFSAEIGMPPYAYLESVRIRHTQGLIEIGKSLAEIAVEAGFSSQSQMTRAFKKIIGVTPGQYAREFDIYK